MPRIACPWCRGACVRSVLVLDGDKVASKQVPCNCRNGTIRRRGKKGLLRRWKRRRYREGGRHNFPSLRAMLRAEAAGVQRFNADLQRVQAGR